MLNVEDLELSAFFVQSLLEPFHFHLSINVCSWTLQPVL